MKRGGLSLVASQSKQVETNKAPDIDYDFYIHAYIRVCTHMCACMHIHTHHKVLTYIISSRHISHTNCAG